MIFLDRLCTALMSFRFQYVIMCDSAWVCAHECPCPRGSKEVIRCPGVRVVGSCKLPSVGTGNRARILLRALPLLPPPFAFHFISFTNMLCSLTPRRLCTLQAHVNSQQFLQHARDQYKLKPDKNLTLEKGRQTQNLAPPEGLRVFDPGWETVIRFPLRMQPLVV